MIYEETLRHLCTVQSMYDKGKLYASSISLPMYVQQNKVAILSIVSAVNSRSEDRHIGIINSRLGVPGQDAVRACIQLMVMKSLYYIFYPQFI